MNFTIVWMPRAIIELTDLWLRAADPGVVTAAVRAIDATIAVDADTVGRPVFDAVRQYTHQPLCIEFEVNTATQRVSVLSVWNAATGRPNPSGN